MPKNLLKILSILVLCFILTGCAGTYREIKTFSSPEPTPKWVNNLKDVEKLGYVSFVGVSSTGSSKRFIDEKDARDDARDDAFTQIAGFIRTDVSRRRKSITKVESSSGGIITPKLEEEIVKEMISNATVWGVAVEESYREKWSVVKENNSSYYWKVYVLVRFPLSQYDSACKKIENDIKERKDSIFLASLRACLEARDFLLNGQYILALKSCKIAEELMSTTSGVCNVEGDTISKDEVIHRIELLKSEIMEKSKSDYSQVVVTEGLLKECDILLKNNRLEEVSNKVITLNKTFSSIKGVPLDWNDSSLSKLKKDIDFIDDEVKKFVLYDKEQWDFANQSLANGKKYLENGDIFSFINSCKLAFSHINSMKEILPVHKRFLQEMFINVEDVCGKIRLNGYPMPPSVLVGEEIKDPILIKAFIEYHDREIPVMGLSIICNFENGAGNLDNNGKSITEKDGHAKCKILRVESASNQVLIKASIDTTAFLAYSNIFENNISIIDSLSKVNCLVSFRAMLPAQKHVISVPLFSGIDTNIIERITNSFIVDLSRSKSIKVIDIIKLNETLKTNAYILDASRLSGAGRIVFGNVYEDGDTLIVEARIVDTRTGSIVCASSAQGHKRNVEWTSHQLATKLHHKLTNTLLPLEIENNDMLEKAKYFNPYLVLQNDKSRMKMKVFLNEQSQDDYFLGDTFALGIFLQAEDLAIRYFYISIFSIDAWGNVSLLFPIRTEDENRFEVNRNCVIPYVYETSGYGGEEFIFAIATTLPMNFMDGFKKYMSSNNKEIPTDDNLFNLINGIRNRLNKLSNAEWAVGVIRFFVKPEE